VLVLKCERNDFLTSCRKLWFSIPPYSGIEITNRN
jgi:hypothetical protein